MIRCNYGARLIIMLCCFSLSLKKFVWNNKEELIQLHFDGLPTASAWHSTHPHWNTHSRPSSAVTAAHSPGVTAQPNHYCALLSNGHQTVGSQQFRTLSHKTKWNPIRSRTTKINLPSELSDQNDFRYKFSVNGFNLFLRNFLKATCKLQGTHSISYVSQVQ